MKIVFYCYGTRGDIQPHLVLSKELKDKGHQVLMVCGKRLKYLVEQFELDCDVIEDDGLDLLFSTELQKKDLDSFLDIRANLYTEKPEILNQYLKSSVGMDLIIPSGLCIAEAMTVSEKLSIPYIPVLLQPSRTGELVCSFFSKRSSLYFSFLNKLSHSLFIKGVSKVEKRRVDRWRKEIMGLGSLDENFIEVLAQDPNMCNIHAYDKILFPKECVPSDYQPGWKVVGFLYPQEHIIKHIPDKLTKGNFFEEEEEECDVSYKDLPIVFGLGSIPISDRQKLVSILKYTIEKLGTDTKWIILNNWTDWEEDFECENVIQLDNVDHLWLFRYCSIAIIHGGIGSCAAVMKSAIPSIVTHFYFDQPINARKLEDLGISISLDYFKLTQEQFLESIVKIKNNYQIFKNQCLQVASKLKLNALDETINLIESNYMDSSRDQ
ncbi:hypothetical protein DICPUDRAFT_35006 [Dictyostelium purpureum]|uniref:Uncharacterized protein n=1 Tax=Dictyostelium purpureum TaxID=5786 RepID=F0ZNM4_DICPU|nr:uncharacterized protein DICPUDRAFT_35006 [Dictyostelium purpureum]EGC34433.1 hypothetical protein DICPUDRAFT_35006 [Dictyostelium purpureum]|eukprot:XP_003289018.1 hypothetical protein DICPUDRAFT_35006 [Dictyostelium purpureum]